MTRKPFFALLAIFATAISFAVISCGDDDDSTEKRYKDWKKFNETWLVEQIARSDSDGKPFYTRRTLPTDPQAYVLMHAIGEVHDGLTPLFTSTTKVNYTLTLANDSVIDRGTDFVSQLNSTSLISGWSLCIMQMHVGDSAQFIIPYAIAYGETGTTAVPPYSNLQFNIRLVDITAYEIRP